MAHAGRIVLVATALISAGAVGYGRARAEEPSVTEPGIPWPVVEDRAKPPSQDGAPPRPDQGAGAGDTGTTSVTEPGMPWPVVRDAGGGASGAAPSGAAPETQPAPPQTNTATQPGLPWPVISEEEAKRLREAASPQAFPPPTSPPPAPAAREAPAGPERSVTEPGMPWPVVQEPPKTPAGTAAPKPTETSDRAACAAALKAALAGSPLSFAAGGAEIEAPSRAVLAKVAGAVKSCGGLSILIVGHTDSRGSEAQNLALSKARAGAVARFLARQGIPEARLKTEGYGASRPVASNETAAGRAMNRRIEILVAPQGSGPS